MDIKLYIFQISKVSNFLLQTNSKSYKNLVNRWPLQCWREEHLCSECEIYDSLWIESRTNFCTFSLFYRRTELYNLLILHRNRSNRAKLNFFQKMVSTFLNYFTEHSQIGHASFSTRRQPIELNDPILSYVWLCKCSPLHPTFQYLICHFPIFYSSIPPLLCKPRIYTTPLFSF